MLGRDAGRGFGQGQRSNTFLNVSNFQRSLRTVEGYA
jgi:hypothetical protein